MKTFRVHSPHRTSLHVIALKGLLMLRKGEQWSWVSDQIDSDVWILDAVKASPEALTDLVQSYESCLHKPLVVFLTDGKLTSPHSAWLSIRAPVHVTKLFQLLDRGLVDHARGEAATSASATAGGQTLEHQLVFDRSLLESRAIKLKQWPNVTRYGHELKYVQACAFLLQEYRQYEALEQLDLTSEELDRLLRDAHDQGFLDAQPPLNQSIKINSMPSNVIPFKSGKSRLSSIEPMGFFRKIMQRFALS